MRYGTARILLSVLFVMTYFQLLYGQHVTLTEVLANEPGGSVYLEWIEVYNPGPSGANISGMFIVENGDTNEIPHGPLIPPERFAVLSRYPISEDSNKMSFERCWGDSSGVWGDSPDENFPLFEVKMTLRNSSGKVVLVSNDDSLSGFTWYDDAGDGTSFEKQDIEGPDLLSNWAISSSPAGSTPGRAPGTEPETKDDHLTLELDPSVVFLRAEQSIKLTYSFPRDSKLTLRLYDINGNVLRTIYDQETELPGEFIFDCTDQSGNLLEGGIYIFYAGINGSQNSEIKKIFVVAGQ